jgi:hypothetical protein
MIKLKMSEQEVSDFIKDNILSRLPDDYKLIIPDDIKDQIAKTISSSPKPYDESVREKCNNDAIIDKKIKTYEYELTIKLYKANYGEYLYWYVGCDKTKTNNIMEIHPFKLLDGDDCYGDDNNMEIWEVVADNKFIRILFEFLSMEDDELSKYTGNNHVIEYRASLIKSATLFWD